MTEFWLIRHGESAANVGKPSGENATIPLTERGYQQANAVADCLTATPNLIITSQYLRARQTAAVLKERYPACPLEEWPVHEFTFLPPDAYCGKSQSDRKSDIEVYWETSDPRLRLCSVAESYKRFIKRVRKVRHLMSAQPTGPVAIFSHRQFIACLIWTLFKNDFRVSSRRMQKFHSLTKRLRSRMVQLCEYEFHTPKSLLAQSKLATCAKSLKNCVNLH